MRSRPELSALMLAVLLVASAPTTIAAGEAPSREQVDSAVERVRADPDLATHETRTQLVWKNNQKKVRKDRPAPAFFGWLTNLLGWIAQASQMLFWLLIATFVAIIAVFLYRMFAARTTGARGKIFVAPTHVQDLDIRPESLPDDIGAEARRLWDQGERRAALALLYRGLLSRLAHTYQVRIRDSSTEGDCLSLAAATLGERQMEYATQLVRTWQRAIYGGLEIENEVIHGLCAGFDQHLDRPAATEAPRRAAFTSEAGA